MKKKIYEEHNLDDKRLPIIFHYDRVFPNRGMISNWHDNIEILYCTEGAGQIICNSVEYNIKKGDLFIINSNALHCAVTDDILRYYCLIVDLNFLAGNDIQAEKMEFDSLVQSKIAADLYEKVVEEIASEEEYRIAGIRARVLELFVYLSRNHSQLASDDKNVLVADENIKLAIGYIKANFQQRITLEGIADEVGLSKYYFARTFKKATGMTFVTYLNVIRCRNAKKLLSTNKYTIHEIANMCGFENDSYFSKTFKSTMGCLPSDLLRQKLENALK